MLYFPRKSKMRSARSIGFKRRYRRYAAGRARGQILAAEDYERQSFEQGNQVSLDQTASYRYGRLSHRNRIFDGLMYLIVILAKPLYSARSRDVVAYILYVLMLAVRISYVMEQFQRGMTGSNALKSWTPISKSLTTRMPLRWIGARRYRIRLSRSAIGSRRYAGLGKPEPAYSAGFEVALVGPSGGGKATANLLFLATSGVSVSTEPTSERSKPATCAKISAWCIRMCICLQGL